MHLSTILLTSLLAITGLAYPGPSKSSKCKTNAECLKRGAPLIRPRQLHNPHRFASRDVSGRYDYINNTAQVVTLPPATYELQAVGAQGGNGFNLAQNSVTFGGTGSSARGRLVVTTPTTITLYVGEQPVTPSGANAGGGGGASWIFLGSDLLIVGGGGGGASRNGQGGNANTGTYGGNGNGGAPGGGIGGYNGAPGGGGKAQDGALLNGSGGGGAGSALAGGNGEDLVGNLNSGTGGMSYPSFLGGVAPAGYSNGGFGGGGAAGTYGAGGGSGYGGSGGGAYFDNAFGTGGGSGATIRAPATVRQFDSGSTGNGYVVIQEIVEI